MKKKSLIIFVALLTYLKCSSQKPNIVFFLVDDLGWMDVGVYGSDFYETPNINQLAKEGVLFTDAYAAAPVCSPTRASIMTGKYPATLKTTDWFGAPQPSQAKNMERWKNKPLLPAEYVSYLPLKETSLAEAFRDAGYQTVISGKWHLGEDSMHWPEHQGFQVNNGGTGKGQPGNYFAPYKNPRLSDDEPGTYIGDRLTDETIRFIESNKNKPFFAYVPFFEVHNPMQAKKELIQKYEKKKNELRLVDSFENVNGLKFRKNQSHTTYAAMVETMDAQVGKLVNSLKKNNLYDNTIIIFYSDNGGLSTNEGSPTYNGPLRAGKGWLYEGGIRVPLIISGPGIKKNITSPEVVISNDIYPTLLELCGMKLKPKQHTGGISLAPALQGKQLKREAIYFHYPHYGNQGGSPGSAIRKGNWKLIHFFEKDNYELYDLSTDPEEKKELSLQYPEVRKELQQLLNTWRKKEKVNYPTINRQ